MPHFDLIIRHGICVLPWGMEQTSVGVKDGHIAALGVAAGATATQTIDAAGLHVLPGLIDPHVHLRDPGDKAVESIPTGTRAAILGGITAVFDMPNTSPSITDAERLAWKQGYAETVAWCDLGLYVVGTKTNIAALPALETGRGVCGIKVFAGSSTGDLMVEDDENLERVMRSGRRRISFHSEDEYRLQARKGLFKSGDPYSNHMVWRDEEAAFLGTRRLMALARQTGGRPRPHPARLHSAGTRLPEGLPGRRHRRGAGQPPYPDRPGGLRHAERLRRDEPAHSRPRPLRGRLGRHPRRHGGYRRLRPRAAFPRQQAEALARLPRRPHRRPNPRPGPAGPRQRRPPFAAPPRKPALRRPPPASTASSARVASPPATMRISPWSTWAANAASRTAGSPAAAAGPRSPA